MSAPSTTLFVHGGGEESYAWGKKIVDRLQPLLGPDMPNVYQFTESLDFLADAIRGANR